MHHRLPGGLDLRRVQDRDGDFRFFLDSDRAGIHAVEVVLTATCDPGDAVEVIAGPRRGRHPTLRGPDQPAADFSANRYYTFRGGCAQYHYRFPDDDRPSLVLEVDQALSFRPREELVRELEARIGLTPLRSRRPALCRWHGP